MSHELAVQKDSVIANMIRASTALAEAKTIQHTKAIVDVAAAAEIYAKRQQLGEEAIGIAHSIKIEALRKLGEMLKETPRAEGNILRGNKMEPRENDPPKLSELGLDKRTSSIAQKLAELPDDEFEQVREGHQSISKAIAAVKETKPKPIIIEHPIEEPAYDPKEDEAAEQLNTIKHLAEENEALKDRIAIDAMDFSEEEKTAAAETIRELRKQVKNLEAELKAVKVSRDNYQRENAEMKKQISMQRKEIERLKK